MNTQFTHMLSSRILLSAGLLSLGTASAYADPVTFNGPGWTTWTAQASGTYEIVAYGAAGGGVDHPLETSARGGNGALVQASFYFDQGTTLTVVVGSKGGDGPSSIFEEGSAGGGGASVVYDANGNPLVVAGGGGGAGSSSGQNGVDASTSVSRGSSSASTPSLSGVNTSDAGGGGGPTYTGGHGVGGAGGGSLSSDGNTVTLDPGGDALSKYAQNNFSGVAALLDGANGGYNGGAPGNADPENDDGFGGGGGGGYSGGGGGGSDGSTGYGGGAGGSYSADPRADFSVNILTQQGEVTIQDVNGFGAPAPSPVPEPSSLLLSATGLLAFAKVASVKLRRTRCKHLR